MTEQRTDKRPQQARRKHLEREVFVVDQAPDGTPRYTRVGVAKPVADGSWDIKLSAVPLAGARVQVLPKQEHE